MEEEVSHAGPASTEAAEQPQPEQRAAEHGGSLPAIDRASATIAGSSMQIDSAVASAGPGLFFPGAAAVPSGTDTRLAQGSTAAAAPHSSGAAAAPSPAANDVAPSFGGVWMASPVGQPAAALPQQQLGGLGQPQPAGYAQHVEQGMPLDPFGLLPLQPGVLQQQGVHPGLPPLQLQQLQQIASLMAPGQPGQPGAASLQPAHASLQPAPQSLQQQPWAAQQQFQPMQLDAASRIPGLQATQPPSQLVQSPSQLRDQAMPDAPSPKQEPGASGGAVSSQPEAGGSQDDPDGLAAELSLAAGVKPEGSGPRRPRRAREASARAIANYTEDDLLLEEILAEDEPPSKKARKGGKKPAKREPELEVPGPRAPAAVLKAVQALLKANTEPYYQNEWRQEPWPARPYEVIPEYQVAPDAGEAVDKAALRNKLFISMPAAAAAAPSEPAAPAETAAAAPPAEPAQPAEAPQAAQAAEPLQAAEAAQPAQPVVPAQPAEPGQSAEHGLLAEPAQPAEPTQPVAPAETAEPVQPAEPLQPGEPAQPAASAEAAEPGQPLEPGQPAESVPLAESAQQAEAAPAASLTHANGILEGGESAAAAPVAATAAPAAATAAAPPDQAPDGPPAGEASRAFIVSRLEAHVRSLALAELPPPLELGTDITEGPAWGLDCYTHRAITDALSTCAELQAAVGEGGELKAACDAFVHARLMPAVNRQGSEGWNVRRALEDLCRGLDPACVDAAAARHLLWAVRATDGALRPEDTATWRVHPKGQGVFAARRIPAGTFVQEYLGELYSPWRWFEKQDLLRKANPHQALPDFYNICLERPAGVEGGADVVFVEAADRGNFASRLSHSCGPNCRNVAVVVGGRRITNALFAARDVEPGEELGWDYACVTESEKEFRAATCLCAAAVCRGSFLYYANSTTFQQVMQQRHTFLDRSALLVRACSEPLAPEDSARLARHGIGASLLGPAPPAWLQKFAALVLVYIELERRLLPGALARLKGFEPGAGELEADGVQENRLQNLAITLDKLAFFLRHQTPERQAQPPLRVLSEAEALAALWTGPESLWERASGAALAHLRKGGGRAAQGPPQITPAEAVEQIEELGAGEPPASAAQARARLLQLCAVLRKCGHASAGLADTLLLAGHTHTLFTSLKFEPVKAKLDAKAGGKGKKTAASGTKVHRPQFAWAQAAAWFKQTVFDPTASLSAERRGALSLPDPETAYSSGGKKAYVGKTRENLVKMLRNSPSNMWPTSLPFSFRNNAKVYGSPMLDAALRASRRGSDEAQPDEQLAAIVASMAAAYTQP